MRSLEAIGVIIIVIVRFWSEVAKEGGLASDDVIVFHLLMKEDKIVSRRYELEEAHEYAFNLGWDLRMP